MGDLLLRRWGLGLAVHPPYAEAAPVQRPAVKYDPRRNCQSSFFPFPSELPQIDSIHSFHSVVYPRPTQQRSRTDSPARRPQRQKYVLLRVFWKKASISSLLRDVRVCAKQGVCTLGLGGFLWLFAATSRRHTRAAPPLPLPPARPPSGRSFRVQLI